jgi:DNA-binding NtrC family response regulator
MSDVDGVTALRRIRVDHPDLPVVMLTANPDVDMALRTIKQGAFDYVTKPIGFTHLARESVVDTTR